MTSVAFVALKNNSLNSLIILKKHVAIYVKSGIETSLFK